MSLVQIYKQTEMRRTILILIFTFLPLLSLAQRFTVKVVGVSDGDTFTAINRDNLQIKFRIFGIDAPEKKQAFGTKSKEYLSSLIFKKSVTVDVQSIDGWGRYIAYVYTPDGKDVSLLMIQAGMAWHFKKYDSNEKYSDAEISARKGGKGLWHNAVLIAPWDFRASKKVK